MPPTPVDATTEEAIVEDPPDPIADEETETIDVDETVELGSS